jgi:hypothetical protein
VVMVWYFGLPIFGLLIAIAWPQVVEWRGPLIRLRACTTRGRCRRAAVELRRADSS